MTGDQGPQGEPGNIGLTGPKGDQGEKGNDGSPDTPFQVRDKLETLKGQDRLQMTAINGLDGLTETLDQLDKDIGKLKKIKAPQLLGGGGSSGGLDTAAGDARYLKLDASNDPLTGTLLISPSTVTDIALQLTTNDTSSNTNPIMQLDYQGAANTRPGIRFNDASINPALVTANVVANWTAFKVESGASGAMAFVLGGYTSSQLNIYPNKDPWVDASNFGASGAVFSFTYTGNDIGVPDTWILLAAPQSKNQSDGSTKTDGAKLTINATAGLVLNNVGNQKRLASTDGFMVSSPGRTSIAIPTGTTTNEDNVVITRNTYALTGSLTNATTLRITNAPSKASGSGTLTTARALWVQAGLSQFSGDLRHSGTNLGFYNAAVIAQPTNAGAAAAFVANTSLIANDTATFDGYTIGQVVKALRNLGILA